MTTPLTLDAVKTKIKGVAPAVKRPVADAPFDELMPALWDLAQNPVPTTPAPMPAWVTEKQKAELVERLKDHLSDGKFTTDEAKTFAAALPTQCFQPKPPGRIARGVQTAWSYRKPAALGLLMLLIGGATGWFAKPAGTAGTPGGNPGSGAPTEQFVALQGELGTAREQLGNKDTELGKLRGDLDKARLELGKAQSAVNEVKMEMQAKEAQLKGELAKEREKVTYAYQVNDIVTRANKLYRDGKSAEGDAVQRELLKLKKPE